MSSVSNEGKRDDAVRRLKDEYYAKEAEDTKKHKAELRRMTEQYQREIEDLKNEHSEKVKQLEGYMKSRLSRQDQQQQNQMQEIRDMYSQQLRKRMEESQSMRLEQKDAYESQINTQKNVFETQKTRIENQLNSELKSKDEAFEKYAQFARDEGDKTWEERRAKIHKSTEQQLQRERENHNNQLSNMSRQLSELQKTKKHEIFQLKEQNDFDINRLELINRKNKENQEKTNAAVHATMSHEYQEQQKLLKEKFRDEIDQKVAVLDESQKDFRQTTGERLNRQLMVLKSDLKNEKNQKIIEGNSRVQQNELEKKHIVQDYEKRLRNERDQKSRALASVKTEVRSEVDKAVKSREELLRDLSDDHLRERELKRSQTTAQMSQVKNDMKSLEDHVTQRADSKVNRANELVRQNSESLQKYYTGNLELIKKDFMKELNNERIRHVEERAELEARLEKKVRDREKSVTQELDQKIIQYEDQISSLKDQFGEELRRKDEEFRLSQQAREKNHKDAIKSMEMKYQNQIQQTKDTANNDLDSQERRHREELNHLSRKINEKQRRA